MPQSTVAAGGTRLLAPATVLLSLMALGLNECPDVPRLWGDLALADADLLLFGTQHNGQAGVSVAVMGDINKDTFDDVLVGAPGEGEGGSEVGRAYLVLGPTTGELDLGQATARFEGYVPGGWVGRSVSSPGDVNKDGYDDVLIGTGTANEAYLFYGPVEGDISCADADVRFIGAGVGDRTGAAVAGIGDVNGDGFPDVAVGAAMADGDGVLDRGAVYLFWGGPGLTGDKHVVDAPVMIIGTQALEAAGTSVAGIGDLNNDGFQDLAIGAPAYGLTTGSAEGAVYVLYGPFSPGIINLQDAAIRFIGESSLDQAGEHISAAGDINGDRISDLLIGARKNDEGGDLAGAAYLIYGGDLPLGDVRLSEASVKFVGQHAGDGAGVVSRGGDVNADGFGDLVIGASSFSDDGLQVGAAYLIYGPITSNPFSLNNAQARIHGVSAFDQAGYGVGGGGDVDGDGFHDIIVGAIFGDGPVANVGTAGVFFGGD